MTTPVLLDRMDEKITAAAIDIEHAGAFLNETQDLCARLERERRQALGQLIGGDITAPVDLDRLRVDYLAARRAAQDAENAVSAARAKVQPLKDERTLIEAQEVAVHLGPMLALREALAALFEAQAAELATTAALYRNIVNGSLRLGWLLNVPTVLYRLNQTVDVVVARRLLLRLRPELMAEFSDLRSSFEDPLPKADAEATAEMRAHVEKVLGATS